jgi:dienelactone hydrolase
MVLPDFFRGDGYDPNIEKAGKPLMDFVSKFTLENCLQDFENVKKYVKETGAKKISVIGICWGVWL